MTIWRSRQIQTDQCGPFEEVLRWLAAAMRHRVRGTCAFCGAVPRSTSEQGARALDHEFSLAVGQELTWLSDEQRAALEALDCGDSSPASRSGGNVIRLSKYRPEFALRARPASRAARPAPRVLWHWPAAATVATVLTLAGAAAYYCLSPGSVEYTTGLGERRVIPLEDGSVVTMNTHSRIRVRFSSEGRNIQLLAGEVLFAVAHDTIRPFRVQAGRAIVQAVGTQFSVYLKGEETRVAVVEGRVKIFAGRPVLGSNHPQAPVPLSAGEEGRVAGSGAGAHSFQVAVDSVAPSALARHLAWRDGQISLDGDTLAEAVEAFNRYNRRHLQIADPSITNLRVGGLFQTMDAESFVAALHALFGIEAVPAKEAILLLRRSS